MGICCMTQGTQTGAQYNLERCDKERDQREIQKGGNIHIPMANSC